MRSYRWRYRIIQTNTMGCIKRNLNFFSFHFLHRQQLLAALLVLMTINAGLTQPLSAYRNGQLLTFAQDNQFWLEFQDSQGFLWGTDKNGRVIRYNGYEVNSFPLAPFDTTGIQCNGEVSFLHDSGGKTWLSIGGCGLDRFEPQTGHFEHLNDELYAVQEVPAQFYLSLYEDSRKNIWIATQRGLYKYMPEGDSISSISRMWHLTIVLEDHNEHIWAVNPFVGKFIAKVEPSAGDSIERLDFPFAGDISKLQEIDGFGNAITPSGAQEGKVFLISYGGHLYRFDVIERKVTPQTNGLREDELVDALFNDGITLVGTNQNRVLQFDHNRNVFLPFIALPPLPGNKKDRVVNIFRTKDGLLWIVTQNRTFQILPKNLPFRKVDFPEYLRKMVPYGNNEQLAAFNGHVYFNTNKGLQPVIDGEAPSIPLEFTNADFKLPPYRPGGYLPSIEKIKELSGFKFLDDTIRGQLWLLLYQYPYGMKLFTFDEDGNRTFRHFCKGRENCFNDHFMDMCLDERGRFWMAGWAGVSCFDPKQEQFTNFTTRNGLPERTATSIAYGQDRGIWIGFNSGGVARYDLEADCFDYYNHDPAIEGSLSSDHRVMAIFASQAGKIWIGTNNGLNRYDPTINQFERFHEADGLPHSSIYSLIVDDNSDLWVATHRQLSRYDKQQKAFYTYSEGDGLLNIENSSAPPLKDAKGRLYFSLTDGVIYFHPDSITDARIPQLYFMDFLLANQLVKVGDSTGILSNAIDFTEQLRLKYQQNVFSIRYAALEYLAPEKINYAFQLEGFDQNWRMVGNTREATYTNLSPGDYLFKVKCRNRHGLESDPITLGITILPPWYRTWWAYSLWVLLLLGLLYAIYCFQLNRKLAQAEARRLKELDTVKTRLYTNITHEFRTPLTVILGMAEQIKSDPKEWLGEGLQMIRRYGNQLLLLVNQMLDLARLESGSLPVNMVQGDIVEYLKYLAESFHSLAEARGISLHFQTEVERLSMDYDPEKLQAIVSNLLSNAIKFTPPGGQVFFRVAAIKQKTPQLQFSIQDTGVGIPKAQLPHIFTRFYQADSSTTRKNEGTGIGLALTKELIQLLGGSIKVKSQVGKGTSFTVLLPLTQKASAASPSEHFSEIQPDLLPFAAKVAESSTGKSETPGAKASENPLLLIVEDNPDVVRYLKACLRPGYQIIAAENGAEGIQKALELIPDIIISDVMMPKKDGFELCDTLKNDERTSHIPIVMLTAKSDVASRIAGLKRGADAYLPKPFNKAELLAHLDNLIELRQKLQQRYQGQLTEAAPEAPDTEVEDAFLLKVKAKVEAHLQSDFSISWLAEEFHMSRVQLFRKVKALTGTSPSLFVRSIRLQRAKELLLTTGLNISEIAYEVGFSDPAFFSRAFREKFGQSPTEVRERP